MIECREIFNSAELFESSAGYIFIADFTERTQQLPVKRGVEIHEIHPTDPRDESQLMDVLTVCNEPPLALCFGIFSDDRHPIDANLSAIKHPEGWFCPKQVSANSFVAFYEIKDCSPRNMSDYKTDIKEKYDALFQAILKKCFPTNQNIYYIVSFPQQKKPYKDFFTKTDPTILKKFLKQYKTKLFCTNHVRVLDEQTLSYFSPS